ncbi:hypothetical protein K7640_08235 [Micromonospora sp. PLK6-60]|uniref:hypothetical protein n=1 Tax=Micromonospora sp. PLK6-60 TaxID=2873383 RepID=UPI001CA6D64F|nr:hypothetical protein [Micromonospora sp. PLK6-60]MBY8871827.1 hypothetical protein [Micromonospora sp. PLK6-60]
MIEQGRRRVPVPVAAASVVLLVAAAFSASRMFNGSSVAAGLVGVLLLLALAYGLWRGSGRARFWATVLATATAGYGVITVSKADASGLLQILGACVVVGLLLVPAASRRWFHASPTED